MTTQKRRPTPSSAAKKSNKPTPKKKEKKKAASRARSFGAAEFTVRCEPTRVQMLVDGSTVVAEANIDVYSELFDLVKACLLSANRMRA